MLVDVIPDEVVVVTELVAVTVVDIAFVTTDDVPDGAVANIKLVVAVTSKTVADVVESPDPGSVVVIVINELTGPGSAGDVVVIIELTGSVFIAGTRVEAMVATGVIDTFKIITLSVVDMPIDASLSIIEILADILIPTTTTIFIVITTLS